MTELTGTETRSVVTERVLAHAPAKVWRALTETDLLDEWLMKSDFQPIVGHRFQFHAEWGSLESEVLTVVPSEKLAYTWEGMGLKSVVTWTLTPAEGGTHLRMEQTGFGPDAPANSYEGAKYGWPRFFDGLERVLGSAR